MNIMLRMDDSTHVWGTTTRLVNLSLYLLILSPSPSALRASSSRTIHSLRLFIALFIQKKAHLNEDGKFL